MLILGLNVDAYACDRKMIIIEFSSFFQDKRKLMELLIGQFSSMNGFYGFVNKKRGNKRNAPCK